MHPNNYANLSLNNSIIVMLITYIYTYNITNHNKLTCFILTKTNSFTSTHLINVLLLVRCLQK